MRGRELRIVFALGLAWAIWDYILWAFTRLSQDQLDWLLIPAAVVVGLSLNGILVRLWSTFLYVPESVSRFRLLGRLLVYAPLLLMALVVLFAVVAGRSRGYLVRHINFLCGPVVSGTADTGRDLFFRLVVNAAQIVLTGMP